MFVEFPTIEDLNEAHEIFVKFEPRGIFYRAATIMVELALKEDNELTLSEAIAVLLQTWNRSFYRYKPFNEKHFLDLEGLLKRHHQYLTKCRPRSIEDFNDQDAETIMCIFSGFREILGKTGTSKCLHLLAPHFFPLWDMHIARSYNLGKCSDAERYCRFIEKTKEQVERVGGDKKLERNALKALDEYNYCNITLKILEERWKKKKSLKEKDGGL